MKRCIQRLLLSFLAVAAANVAIGATIAVRKDGTGDYSVIQQALDVAADGDTVLIGPGEYTESTMVRLPGWAYDIESFAHLRTDNLTIIGAGAEVTIIGPTTYEGSAGTGAPAGLSNTVGGGSLHISDVGIRHCYAVYIGGALYMDRCSMRNNRDGLVWEPSGPGGWVRDSVVEVTEPIFDPMSFIIVGTGSLGSGVELERCSFGHSGSIRTVSGMIIRNCDLTGLALYSGARVAVDGCTSLSANSGITLALGTGIYCEVRNSTLRGQTVALAIVDSAPGGLFVVENSRLEGGSDSVFYAAYNAGASVVHNCDLVKGTGLVVRCGAQGPPQVHDFSNNYWGTTSEAQIRAWIFDHSDNGAIGGTVLYTPFAGQSVPSETTSWGDLKALWR